MENLLKLLFILFVAIAVMVVVLERFGKPIDDEQQAKLSRWIIPLLAVLIIAQIIRHYFF